MAGGQVLVRVPLLDQSSCGMRPGVVAVLIQIVAEVPGDVGKGSESCNCVLDEAVFVVTRGRGVNTAVIHIQHQRKYHVAISGEAKRTLELLPIGHLKAAIVESW